MYLFRALAFVRKQTLEEKFCGSYLSLKRLIELLLVVGSDVFGVQLRETVTNPANSRESMPSELILPRITPEFQEARPCVLLQERSADRLRGMRGENEIHGLVLQSVEDFLGRLVQTSHEPLQGFLDIGFRGSVVLVDEIPRLFLVPPSARDLHLLREIR